MAASEAVTALVDQLVALFNRRSMDLPDGVFTRHTRFLLNGVAFEEMLGRPPDDPLILMLTRGAAGYRFTAKALQHVLPDATLQRGELEETAAGDAQIVRAQCWLSGHLRRAGEAVELLADVELQMQGQALAVAHATVDPVILQRLQDERRHEA